jgi:hypothetical protein
MYVPVPQRAAATLVLKNQVNKTKSIKKQEEKAEALATI